MSWKGNFRLFQPWRSVNENSRTTASGKVPGGTSDIEAWPTEYAARVGLCNFESALGHKFAEF